MDILLDAGCYSDEDIHDEIITLLFAGTETNATTVCFTLLMLAMSPNIQEKVYDELKSVFGTSDRPMETSDLSKLRFLEQCIKESLRKTAPPVVLRAAQTDTTVNDGRIVPGGAAYLLSIFEIHHDPDIYPDPYTWNPNHFDGEKVATRPANSFIPFGAGARVCIGYRYAMMTMKVILSTVLRNFELKTSRTQVTLDFTIIVGVKEGYNVELHPRKREIGRLTRD